MGSALQYDSRDAVLGGLRRDYNLADYPLQANDLVVNMSVQPVVDIKDSVTIRNVISVQIFSTAVGAWSKTFHLIDRYTSPSKRFKGYIFKILNINVTSFNSAATPTFIGCIHGALKSDVHFVKLSPTVITYHNTGNTEINMLYDTANFDPYKDEIYLYMEGTNGAADDIFIISFDVEMTPGKAQSLPRMP